MNISKTQFKQYSRCENFINLEKQKIKVNKSNLDESQQLEFEEVELLAGEFLKNKLNKKLEYHRYMVNENDFYTELDYSYEDESVFNIYEIKATTQKKFVSEEIKKNSKQYFFNINDNGIFEYIFASNNLNPSTSDLFKTEEQLQKKIKSFEDKMLDKNSNTGKYIYDCAISYFASKDITKYKNKKIKVYLICLNQNFVYKTNTTLKKYTNTDLENMYSIIDVTYFVLKWQEEIQRSADLIKENINKDDFECKNLELGKYCKFKESNYKCKYFDHCLKLKQIDAKSDDSIFNLYRINEDKLFKYLKEDKKKINQLSYQEIKTDSVGYVQKELIEKNQSSYIDTNNLKQQFKKLKFPLYHLDFEAVMYVLPIWDNQKPYDQSCFQYSMHVQESMDQNLNEIKHYEYLQANNLDPRYKLFCSLVSKYDFSKDFTTIVFSKNFETARIKEAIQLFSFDEKLCQKLQIINDSILDLKDFFILPKSKVENGGNGLSFYKNDFHGSFSIKKILPSLVPSLSYSNLNIANGTQAMSGFKSFTNISNKDKLEELVIDMKYYCKQDTLAMILILKELNNLI